MPRNGAGVFSLVNNTWFPPVNGVLATSADWNTFISDVASALTQSVSSDGQTPMTGNLPMGNNKITGLAPGTANTDAINFTQQIGRLLGVQVFTSNGTYTPTTGTTRIILMANGCGGGGGGGPATGAGTASCGGGGGGGAHAIAYFTTGFSGSAVSLGSGGAGGAGIAGTAGTTSTFGALMSVPGGGGGAIDGPSAGVTYAVGGVGGTLATIGGGTVILNTPGEQGAPGLNTTLTGGGSGKGGMCGPSAGAPGVYNTNGTGSAGFGGGGSGAHRINSQGSATGGLGGAGRFVVFEYA